MQAVRTIRSYVPVLATDGTNRLIGWIVQLSDGTTYFEQRKRVVRGACANYGPRWTS